nr:hypothetical protein [Tanacetum cinerariifolium]
MVLVGNENKNVPLYYHIVNNLQIQFGREEFCLVTGSRFEVEYWADYDKDEDPIPFRRRVFSSFLDGKHITGKIVETLIDSKLFGRVYDDDVVSLCCVGILQLVFLGVEGRRILPDWILRLATDRVGWDNRPLHLCNPLLFRILVHINGKSQIPSHMGNPNSQNPIETHPYGAGLLDQIMSNRGKREQRSSMYRWTPYVEQPPTTVLPKQCGIKNKNKVHKAAALPLNLENVFDDDNEGSGDIMFVGCQFTGNMLVYENVDPNKTRTGQPSGLVFQGRLKMPRGLWPKRVREGTKNLLSKLIKLWTPLINNILQERGCFNETRGPHYFEFAYNDGLGIDVPQQPNFSDCGVITCWLIFCFCSKSKQIVKGNSQAFQERIGNKMCQYFYSCRYENTRECGYD